MATPQRPEYRDAKTPRAVKVYTIAQESRYVVFENVPALGLVDNLLKQCASFGPVEAHRVLEDRQQPEFTEAIWVKFSTWRAARAAKLTMDDKPFFTNLLRVSYAPEYETVEDTRSKLEERRQAVSRRQRRRRPQQPKPQPQPFVAAGSAGADADSRVLSSLGAQPKKRRRI